MLLYFILGSLFSQIVLPIFDGIAELILSIIESGKGFFAVKCAKYNKQIGDLTEGDDPKESKKRPIGFFTSAIGEQIDSTEEDEEFDE